jgi:hypothetical protein
MHGLYDYELMKIQQREAEERAQHARLVNIALRARRRARAIERAATTGSVGATEAVSIAPNGTQIGPRSAQIPAASAQAKRAVSK